MRKFWEAITKKWYTFKTNPFSVFYICKLPAEQLNLILKLKRSNYREVGEIV